MIEVIFLMPRNEAGEVPTFPAEVPALPWAGAWIENEVAGYRGYVSGLSFYWAPDDRLQIHIQLR